MRDLNNIKDQWKVYYEEKINSSLDSLWDLISSPSNLEIFHPFCKSNKIIKWPGEHSIDELIYLNGLTFIRKFKSWDKKKGYSLLIGEKEKEQSKGQQDVSPVDPYGMANNPYFAYPPDYYDSHQEDDEYEDDEYEDDEYEDDEYEDDEYER